MSSSPSLDPEIVDAVHLLLRNSHGQRSVGGDRPPFFTAVAAVKIANALADASSTIRAVVSERMAHHFHMFEPSLSPSVSSTARMWIPRDDDAHWEAETYFLETFRAGDITRQDLLDQIDAFDRYSPTDAQSMKVDARIPAISVLPPSALYGPDCFPLWMASTTLICRVGMPNPNLKFLHLRFSADSTLLARVVQIVSASCAVRDVVVEVDHPRAHPQDTDVPILHLSKLALAGQEYAELERFVFRAPGVDVRVGDDAPFARRVTQCTTFVLAVRSMHLTTPVWQWSMHLLHGIPKAQRIEMSVACDSDANVAFPRNFAHMDLPYLTHLTIDFFNITSAFLQNVSAPCLTYVRIRTNVPLGSRGRCSNHLFPAISSAAIHCPGNVQERFRALGLAKRQFIHCFDDSSTSDDVFDGEVVCIGITSPPSSAERLDFHDADGEDDPRPLHPLQSRDVRT